MPVSLKLTSKVNEAGLMCVCKMFGGGHDL
jgi:hypothetical protein